MYYITKSVSPLPQRLADSGLRPQTFFKMKKYMYNLFSFCKEYPVWAAVFFSFGYLIGEIYVV